MLMLSLGKIRSKNKCYWGNHSDIEEEEEEEEEQEEDTFLPKKWEQKLRTIEFG